MARTVGGTSYTRQLKLLVLDAADAGGRTVRAAAAEPNPAQDWPDAGVVSAPEFGVALTRPEGLTPLPLADQALPTLELFARLVGRSQARVRVAAIRDLAMQSMAGVELVDLQRALDWLEPRSASRTVAQLRGAGLLELDADQSYRLPRSGRVVGALCAALMVPQVDYGGIVRALGRLVSFTRDLGGDETQALVPFRIAVAVCEEDLLELRRLLDDYSIESLRSAAELGKLHATHMQELLAEQQQSHPVLGADPRWLALSDRASRVVASLFRLSTEVLQLLAEVAEQRLRGGSRLDRDDVRAYIIATPLSVLAGLLGDRLVDPARVSPYDLTEGLRVLDVVWRAAARRRPVPPEPTALDTRPLPPAPPDLGEEMAAALVRVAQGGGGWSRRWSWVAPGATRPGGLVGCWRRGPATALPGRIACRLWWSSWRAWRRSDATRWRP